MNDWEKKKKKGPPALRNKGGFRRNDPDQLDIQEEKGEGVGRGLVREKKRKGASLLFN